MEMHHLLGAVSGLYGLQHQIASCRWRLSRCLRFQVVARCYDQRGICIFGWMRCLLYDHMDLVIWAILLLFCHVVHYLPARGGGCEQRGLSEGTRGLSEGTRGQEGHERRGLMAGCCQGGPMMLGGWPVGHPGPSASHRWQPCWQPRFAPS